MVLCLRLQKPVVTKKKAVTGLKVLGGGVRKPAAGDKAKKGATKKEKAPKTEKKEKAEKEDRAPRAKSAYQLFSSEQRGMCC